MLYSRRNLVVTLATAAAALAAESALFSQSHGTPQPRPSPNTPDPSNPWGLQGPPQKPTDKQVVNQQNQAEVRSSVQKLYELITELKEEVERSDTTKTLSVSVVKKSQQIEKLAKHVREVAKS
jgi:hypothetical protein